MPREERPQSRLAITMADERPTDFGTFLRVAREQKGVSLQEVAAATKISARVLEALERNDPAKLPGGIFSRAFVRSYAREVGLDPEVAVASFVSAFPDEAGAEDMPATTSAVEAESFEHRRRVGKALVRVLGVAIVAAILWVIYYSTWGRSVGATNPAAGYEPAPVAQRQTAPPAAAPPPTVTPAAAAPSMAAASPAESGAAPNGTASTVTTPPAESPAPVQPPPASPSAAQAVLTAAPVQPAAEQKPDAPTTPAPLTVGLAVSADCWVSISVDGTRVPSRTLSAGERLQFPVQRSITLSVGNAGALAVTLNGKPAKPLGGPGQVVTTTITAAAFQSFLQ